MAKTGSAAKAGGGFLKKMLGDMIRPAAKRAGRSADNVVEGAADDVAKEAAEKAAKEARDKANKEINDTLAKTNPKFKQGREYQVNCTGVAQAYELRRRGIDVTAGPIEAGKNGRPTAKVVQDIWGQGMTDGSKDDIVKAFEGYGDGARGVVRIRWDGGGGHAFNVENVGGQVRFIDGQPPGGRPDVAHYFDKGSKTQYVRLDHLPDPDPSKYGKYME
jgi:Papain fold toxin 1, glutamine deamidase